MNRRGFLKSIFVGAGVAALPSLAVTAIKTVAPELFYLHGDGVRDDTRALQALIDGKSVVGPNGSIIVPVISNGITTIFLPSGVYKTRACFW